MLSCHYTVSDEIVPASKNASADTRDLPVALHDLHPQSRNWKSSMSSNSSKPSMGTITQFETFDHQGKQNDATVEITLGIFRCMIDIMLDLH